MARTIRKPLKVFCSYSHQDEHYLEVMKTWLVGLFRDGLIEEWHDRMISPGQEWEEAIAENLETSDMVLLLVTPDFIASQYIYEKEIDRAIERHKRGEARVIPIIVRPAPWEGTALDRLQALPKNARAITTWANRDQAWLNVLQGIQQAVQELLFNRQAPEQEDSSEQVYREAVEWAWADRELHSREVERLSDLAGEYELSTDSASDIEREVMGHTKEAILERQEQAGWDTEREEQPEARLESVKVFCIYSRRDEHYLDVLKTWLVGLEREGLIEQWHDRMIAPGEEWDKSIAENLANSDMVLLLITPDFIASQYIYEKEISRAVERHGQGRARVVPIIVRPSPPLSSTPFSKLQVLPKDAKPVTNWVNQDEAWLDVLDGIQQAVQELVFESQSLGSEQSSEQIYREAVEWAWADRELHSREVERLSDLAGEYELSTDSASDIEREVMGHTKEAILERQEQAGRDTERKKRLEQLYTRARALHRDQEWQAVIDVFAEIHAEDSAYPDSEGLLLSAREALEMARKEQDMIHRYREAVESIWADRQLNRPEVEWLDVHAEELGLSASDASAIEREVMGETKEAIIEQNPTAGTEVEAGNSVEITVNSGSSTVEMPAEQPAPKQPDVLTPETIFVSYSHKDWDEFVEPLVIDLRQRGLKVWIDQLSIKGGTDWGNVIDKALKTCQRMVVCVSPNSMDSDEVKSEFRYFLRRYKTVYPLLCREADTPYDLDKLQYISYEQRAKFIEELSQ